MGRVKRVKCPECGESFDLESDLEVGDVAVCPGCYVELKILELNPPLLKADESDLDYDDAGEEDEDKEFEEEEEEEGSDLDNEDEDKEF